MALSQPIPFSSLVVSINKHYLAGESQHQRTVKLPAAKSRKSPLISSFRTAKSKPFSPLRKISCVVAGEGSSLFSTSISSVFVKGLADSVSEGRLRKVFSEFGQVNNVKIIINEKTQKSLGYGYVWFNSRENAELAVEAMNGKFFDGRFILVKLGQPGLSSSRRRSHSNFPFSVNK